jgi:hypothetical protein
VGYDIVELSVEVHDLRATIVNLLGFEYYVLR